MECGRLASTGWIAAGRNQQWFYHDSVRILEQGNWVWRSVTAEGHPADLPDDFVQVARWWTEDTLVGLQEMDGSAVRWFPRSGAGLPAATSGIAAWLWHQRHGAGKAAPAVWQGVAPAPLNPPPPNYQITFARSWPDDCPAPRDPEQAMYAAAEAGTASRNFRAPTRAGAVIAGTLVEPAGRPARGPLVVLISGAGPSRRDHNSAGHNRAFRSLSTTLARAGWRVVRYDDPGAGFSTGFHPDRTTELLADDLQDVIAAVPPPRTPGHGGVVLVGFSEGAVIALVAAAREPGVRGVVTLSGPAARGDSILRFQRRRWCDDPLGRRCTRAELDSVVQAFGRRDAWSARFLTLDPLDWARQVRQPALIIHGTEDSMVPPEHSAGLAEAIRAGSSRRPEVVRVTGMTHGLSTADTPLSPAVATALLRWLETLER